LVQSIPNPRQRTNLGPRIDWALTKNNTLTVRYQYYRDTQTNTGVGVLILPSQGYYSQTTEDTVQVSDTQVFGSKIVNETRFQYNRDNEFWNPNDTNPAVNVLGYFTGGGSAQGKQNDLQNNYEVQNYTSLISGNHTLKFGARVRATREADYTTSGFNGTFTFSSLNNPTHTQSNCTSISQNPPCPISLQYAEQQLAGGGGIPYATQLTFTQGTPTAQVTYYDVEPYIQDDWRVKPNLTLSSGLRFESQNAIPDHGDWAPRFGFAWGVGGRNAAPKVVIRGGYGIFYDRFQTTQLLKTELLDGVTQQQFIIDNPTCFPGEDKPLASFSNCGPLNSSVPNVYQISPRLRAPYTLQGAIGVERQLSKSATLSVIYMNSRGFDQFALINADAPYPGTPCAPNCPPIQGGNVYRYVSEANFKQNQLMANTNVRIGSKVQLFGYYSLSYANSDASGVSSFASNSHNISQDYGRASFDIRHRFFLGGSIALPYLFRLSPFMVVSSGSPFNITSPIDVNGDQIYNDRPGLVSTATCPNGTPPTGPQNNIYCTTLGIFDVLGGGKLLPINYGNGPAHFVMNLRFTKTFGFGPKAKSSSGAPGQGRGPDGGGGHGGGGGRGGPIFGGGPMMMSSNTDRRYNLTLGVIARNAFNNYNLANPNGVVGSRLFGESNSPQLGGPFSPGTAANRKIELQATFSF
jgi:hypothetical protein